MAKKKYYGSKSSARFPKESFVKNIDSSATISYSSIDDTMKGIDRQISSDAKGGYKKDSSEKY